MYCKIRILFRFLSLSMLFSFNAIIAQTPKQDLSRGNYLILQKPFQIEAMGFPHRFDETATTKQMQWDLDIYKTSNYTSHIVGIWHLAWWPVGAGDIPWSRLLEEDSNGNPIELTALELSKFDNIVRFQWEDDNLHPADSAMVAKAKKWFEKHQSDPAYDDKILSIDLRPYGYTSAQLDTMLIALNPDLIMFNRYPWEWSDEYHFRQLEYGWYAMLIYNRNLAQLGNDRTGAKPVPFGAFTQNWRNGRADLMPHSFMKYNNFLSLAFGAKYLSTFLYTSWPYWHADKWGTGAGDPNLSSDVNGLESTLFDNEFPFAPTSEFYVQAEINRQITNIGPALVRLQTSGVRFIRATNIESFVQNSAFAGGTYDWDFGTRPDTLLTNITVTRTGFAETQDVWVGYFNPVHHTIDGTGTTNEDYFMLVNGCWDVNETSSEQTIRLHFDFGTTTTINSLMRLSRLTGEIEILPLVKEGSEGNKYYYDLVLNGGEGDLLKYNNGIPFVGFPVSTGINTAELLNQDVQIFPNPATSQLYLKVKSELLGCFYKVYDSVGKTVLSGKITSNNTLLEVSSLKNGIYFLSINDSEKRILKIIKE